MDDISSFFLKKGMPVLASSLSQLPNLSMSIAQFLVSWKVARVAPIYKNYQTDERYHYRSISLLPVVAKLFETLIYEQPHSYLNGNSLLLSSQSGFQALHSVLTSLLHFMNDWYLNLDKGSIQQHSLTLRKLLIHLIIRNCYKNCRYLAYKVRNIFGFYHTLKTTSSAVRLMAIYRT